jgi:hypothetical protein
MVLIQLLLPTAIGSERRDATALLADTRRELAGWFKGITAYVRSPAKGMWTSPEGCTEADDVVMMEIVTPTFEQEWWRIYAANLAERFEQKTIHVRALPVTLLDEESNVAPSRRADIER